MKQFDKPLLLAVLALLVFGVIMITSIGVPKSIQLSAPHLAYPNCSHEEVDCYFLVKKHFVRLIIGLIAMFVIYKINYRIWKKLSLVFFVGAFLMLIAVLIMGTNNNTSATSWFNLYNSSLQPSEFAKLAMIFYMATWMEKKVEDIKSFKNGFIPFCIVSGAILLPVILQPDLGSTLVFIAICVTVYFVAGARIRDLGFGALVTILITVIIAGNVDYIKERFTVFLLQDEECHESYCWQSEQANIAIGSGGLWGRGLTQGIQKSYWLPQASDDFIFAASAEELGLIRIILVVMAYFYIAYRGFMIATNAPNRFSMLVATGITTWIVSQAFLNIAVNTSLFPVTGVTLPFISYGGSSLMASLMGIGVLLNISKYSNIHENNTYRRGDRRSHISKFGTVRRSL